MNNNEAVKAWRKKNPEAQALIQDRTCARRLKRRYGDDVHEFVDNLTVDDVCDKWEGQK